MRIILLIAEDRALHEALRAALPETDLLLVENTAEEAVRRLISVKADLVIIDDQPRLGLKALQSVREAAPETPALMLCVRDDEETRTGYTLAGAQACLAKPFACETLRHVIYDLLARPEPAPKPCRGMPAEPVAGTGITQHQTALRWLSRTFSHIKDPVRFSESLVDAATDIFDPVRSAVLIETDGTVRVAASHGITAGIATSLKLSYATGLMRWFEANLRLFDQLAADNAPEATKEMAALGARLAVPLVCGGRARGALVIGEKATGGDYSREERELLIALTRCASIALENSALYEDISGHRGRLDAILANVAAGVVVIDTDKTVSMMNQSAERILQLRAVNVLGRSVSKLGSPFADVVLRTLADRQPRLRHEIYDPAIDAQVGLSVTPLASTGVVAIFSEIPAHSMPSEEIAYSPFWEYLATRVAQEIKNPMVAVNTFAQLLPSRYESEDFRETFAQVVQQEVARINSVVDTLFDFASRPRLVFKRTSMNEAVRNILRSFEETLKSRSIELETEWAQDLPDIDLDPVLFSKAVQNILQNSVEAMPAGGRLKVVTRARNGDCEVLITDTGTGIPEQDASLIFMPFFSTKEQGMGLGLTIATRIMKEHAGDLQLVTEANGGGAFALRIPLTRESYADHPSN